MSEICLKKRRTPSDIPPEVRILAWTALRTDNAADRLRSIAQNGLDWERLLALALRHRMVSLLYASVCAGELDPPPPSILRELAAEARAAGARTAQQFQDLTWIISAFDAAGIPLVVLKGVPLSERLYGNPMLRDAKDIDLLVRPRDRRAARDVLLQEGYQSVGPPTSAAQDWFLDRFGTQMAFIHPVRGTNIDLRWTLHQRSTPSMHPLSLAAVGSSPPPSPHQLSPAQEALDLLAHGADHIWFRLKWLTDLWQAWCCYYDVDWSRWRRDALETGLGPALTSATLLARWIVPEHPLPAAVAGDSSSHRGWLVARFASRTIVAPTPKDRPSAEHLDRRIATSAFKLLIAAPERRWQLMRSGLICAADIGVVELPRWAYVLYPPLKPLWWVLRRLRSRVEGPIPDRALPDSPQPVRQYIREGGTYVIFGLRVASDVPLPLVPSDGEGPADVTVSVTRGLDPGAEADDWGLTVPACGRIVVHNGSSVLLEPAPGADATDLELHLLGSTLGLLCWARRWVPLHASAVRFDTRTILFAGASGIGKSTLAAACVAEGAELLSDDLSPLTVGADGKVVMPGAGPRRIKLWPDAVRRFTPPVALQGPVQAGVNKLDLKTPPVRDQAVHATTLLCLEKAATPLPVSRIQGVDALRAVAASVYRPTLMPPNIRPHALEAIATVAREMECLRVGRPVGLDAVGDLARRLAAGWPHTEKM